MRKMKSGIRSTKRGQTNSTTPQATKQQPRQTKKMKDIMVKLVDIQDEPRQTVYTDQTGKFPTKSSKGNQYIMVIAELDSDAILFEPVKSKAAGDMVNAWQRAIDRLKKCGITPKHQILDNEISTQYKEATEENNMTYQRVPPHDHRRNIAENRIGTGKAHIIANLCGVSPKFPLHLWDRLLPQMEMTRNMLRPSNLVLTILAHAYLRGQHDYNSHPLAPLGYEVETQLKPTTKETWAPHSASGFKIGTSFEHY